MTEYATPRNKLWIPSGKIEIRTRGQRTVLRPAIDGLERIFFTSYSAMMAGDQADIVALLEPLLHRYHEPPLSPHFVFWAGLVSLLKEFFLRLGVTLKGVPATRPMLPPIDKEGLSAFKIVDRHVLDFVRKHDRCLIRYGRRVRPADLIAQMIRAFPTLTFVIATTRKRDATRLVVELATLGVQVAHFHERNYPTGERVIVGTYLRFADGAAAVRSRDVFVAMNPTELFDGDYRDYATSLLGCLHRARAIGMLAESTPVAPRTRDLMTALFGPDEVVLPRHGYRNRDAEVFFTPITGGPPMMHRMAPHLVRRIAVCEHPIRNRRIVALARALEAGDWKKVRESVPKIGPRLTRLKRAQRKRICVVVDDVDHGVTLGTELGWPVVAGAEADGVADDKTIAVARRNKQPVVSTMLALGKAGDIDILLRADGGNGIPELPPRVVHEKSGERRPLLIIDCDDRHHPLLAIASRKRRRDYEAARLPVDGKMISELDRFLHMRPQVYGLDSDLLKLTAVERS